jgi:hypothetical protein
MFCTAFRSDIIRMASGEPNTRWDVPGSRLFNTICGRVGAETKIVGCLEYDPKRLPSRRGRDTGLASSLPGKDLVVNRSVANFRDRP